MELLIRDLNELTYLNKLEVILKTEFGLFEKQLTYFDISNLVNLKIFKFKFCKIDY